MITIENNRDQAYQIYIQNTATSQEKISAVAQECLRLQMQPQGLIRGAVTGTLRWATSYLWKQEEKESNPVSITPIEKESIEELLRNLGELFQDAKNIKTGTDKDFTIACDLLTIHYDILVKQWELLETLHGILDRQKNQGELPQDLQDSIHSLLKTVILQIGQETEDPLLSNEEVVSQLIQHQSELSEEIFNVKEILLTYIEKNMDEKMLGDKVLSEKEHQTRFETQLCRVERWRQEYKLALQLQKLSKVDTKSPLTAKRKELLEHLRKEHNILKNIQKRNASAEVLCSSDL